MAKVSDIVKFTKKQKYKVRAKNRCNICGRARSFMRKFGLCRICFRELALKGELPGVIKSTW
ncbi:type Z 30S ribosomal protein S14 [Patescibacteria group bacterium]|nr:type Z 30S ribosomal protein S14 [Patescibacteria group bacterium]MCL5010558.1 type Z 30S ribosomal protein S14 [Patescibacteria group bacterium]